MRKDEKLKYRRELMARMQKSAQVIAKARYQCVELLEDDPEGTTDVMNAWKKIVEGGIEHDDDDDFDPNVGEFILSVGYNTIMNWINERVLEHDILEVDGDGEEA